MHDGDSLRRPVNGALKCAIDAHGPITRLNYGSAGKRILSQILKMKSDYIPWKVMNCESETCPLICRQSTEIDDMTGEKAAISKTTICPECLRSITWQLRDLMNREGELVHHYCHGVAIV